MDPLTKGSLFHAVQTEFYRAPEGRRRSCPSRPQALDEALAVLDTIGRGSGRSRARSACARHRARVGGRDRRHPSRPALVGRPDRARRATDGCPSGSSGRSDSRMAARWPRGATPTAAASRCCSTAGSCCTAPSISSRSADRRLARPTSIQRAHRRASAPNSASPITRPASTEAKDRMIIGGGRTLQPVLYSLALEAALRTAGRRRDGCITRRPTADSGTSRSTMTTSNRRAGLEALEIIDRAVETGFLAPAPDEGVCTWCDFRPVCGSTRGAAQSAGRRRS